VRGGVDLGDHSHTSDHRIPHHFLYFLFRVHLAIESACIAGSPKVQREAVVVHDVPVEDIEFVGHAAVDGLLYHWQRYKMSRGVQHYASEIEGGFVSYYSGHQDIGLVAIAFKKLEQSLDPSYDSRVMLCHYRDGVIIEEDDVLFVVFRRYQLAVAYLHADFDRSAQTVVGLVCVKQLLDVRLTALALESEVRRLETPESLSLSKGDGGLWP
jgi:hypothetical protein